MYLFLGFCCLTYFFLFLFRGFFSLFPLTFLFSLFLCWLVRYFLWFVCFLVVVFSSLLLWFVFSFLTVCWCLLSFRVEARKKKKTRINMIDSMQ